jgi:hypothetical protein
VFRVNEIPVNAALSENYKDVIRLFKCCPNEEYGKIFDDDHNLVYFNELLLVGPYHSTLF